MTNGKVKGVSIQNPQGHNEIIAPTVIIAAGGLGTPVILQRSGIKEAGAGLFVDLFVNTYGVTKALNQVHEPPMALVDCEFHKSRGFVLAPYINRSKAVRFRELGLKGLILPVNRLVGMMTKIVDEPTGCVYADGTISKTVTERDWARLKEGSSISKEILIKAGADSKSIMVSAP